MGSDFLGENRQKVFFARTTLALVMVVVALVVWCCHLILKSNDFEEVAVQAVKEVSALKVEVAEGKAAVKESARAAMSAMAAEDQAHHAAKAADRRAVAAEVCLDWVLGVLRTHTGNEDLAVHGSLILRRVSWASKDGEAMMRMEEVVTQTLRAYRGSAAVVDNCLVCLRNLACHKANKAVLAERALPLVVDLLMEQGPVRTTTADAALWFLSNLAEVTEVRVSSVGCSEPVAPQAS